MKDARKIRDIVIIVDEKNKEKQERYENDQINKVIKKYKQGISELERTITEEAKNGKLYIFLDLKADRLFSKIEWKEYLIFKKYMEQLEYGCNIQDSVEGWIVKIDWYDHRRPF